MATKGKRGGTTVPMPNDLLVSELRELREICGREYTAASAEVDNLKRLHQVACAKLTNITDQLHSIDTLLGLSGRR
jgi:hypothetical protein